MILNYVCKIRISKCQEGAQWIGVIFKGLFHKGVHISKLFLFKPTTDAYPEMSEGLKFRKNCEEYIGLYSDFWPHVG